MPLHWPHDAIAEGPYHPIVSISQHALQRGYFTSLVYIKMAAITELHGEFIHQDLLVSSNVIFSLCGRSIRL
jgi:hypothetical protein